MHNALLLREADLARLSENIINNKERYLKERRPWLDSYFGTPDYAIASSVQIASDLSLKPPEEGVLHDLENAKTLYSALRHLTPAQAADPRLWAYMTHVTFWEYMRKRWPPQQYATGARFKESIQERYFFMSHRERALLRNGISRLWWIGYSTYDDTRVDPFELTAVLLKRLDVTQSILERTFSRNMLVTRTILNALAEEERAGRPFYVRNKVRGLAKYLVQVGGVTIIDALDPTDLHELIVERIGQLRGAA